MKIQSTSGKIQLLKEALPFWCNQFEYACILYSNNIASAGHNDTYEIIAGIAGTDAKIINDLQDGNADDVWKLGYLTYEFNHVQHGITHKKRTLSGFQPCFFFIPQLLILIRRNSAEIEIHGADPGIIEEIINYQKSTFTITPINLVTGISREKYIANVEIIKEQILEGTFYELNYCMEFFQEDAEISAPHVFERLNKISPTPFATFFKNRQKYLLCASPERFLKKAGDRIIAQPIKGTSRRSADIAEDERLKINLQQSEKERAENIMIVDLMRNDLAQCAETGSVNVDELFAVYSFATVHQLISTVSATLRKNSSVAGIINKTFPMGSMTGAPKREVMHFIDQLEPTARGIFSGSIGYISPENDFDFNVVIRSIIYNSENKYLSCFVGSAITFDADPSSEYEECLLKTTTMFNALDTKKIVP